jgi:hypothetical protein
LLNEKQVIFIDDYPTQGLSKKKELMRRVELTVRDNMIQGIPSLLINDDCEDYMFEGKLPIKGLLKNGRVMWLTIITLWQGCIKSVGDGPDMRKQMSIVVCFSVTIPQVASLEAWCRTIKRKHLWR